MAVIVGLLAIVLILLTILVVGLRLNVHILLSSHKGQLFCLVHLALLFVDLLAFLIGLVFRAVTGDRGSRVLVLAWLTLVFQHPLELHNRFITQLVVAVEVSVTIAST